MLDDDDLNVGNLPKLSKVVLNISYIDCWGQFVDEYLVVTVESLNRTDYVQNFDFLQLNKFLG